VARAGGRISTYKVAQILDVRPTGAHFRRPAGFDLAEHWRASLADFDRRRYTDEATVALTPRGLRRVPDHLGPALAAAIEATATPQADGRYRARIPVEAVDQALASLLRLGAEIEIIGPPPLRAAFASTVAAMSARYATTPLTVGVSGPPLASTA
jgi:WYL domain-containing protein